jgi:acyl-CoA thioesterase
MVTALVGTDIVGSFPAVEMRKVDMRAYNADKPLWEKRELILYRLLRPLPSDGTDGWDANAHVCVHAYAVDRNGLTMLCNLAGIGDRFGRAASLSYSLVVHVNVAEAVMEGNGWWVQEAGFPRAGAGRGMIVSRVWSPGGVHVATEYQDGLCQAFEERRGMWREEKL